MRKLLLASALAALLITAAAAQQAPNTGGMTPNSAGGSITISGKSVPIGGAYAPARSSYSGSSPGVGTTLASAMGGLAGATTPATSGNVLVLIDLTTLNNTAASSCTAQITYGTGTAPAHNATATGTTISNPGFATSATASAFGMIPLMAYIPNLTVGTTYWLDVQYGQNSGGTCTIQNYSIQAVEQ